MGIIIKFPNNNVEGKDSEHEADLCAQNRTSQKSAYLISKYRDVFDRMPACQRQAIVRLSLLCFAFAAIPVVIFMGYVAMSAMNLNDCSDPSICSGGDGNFIFIYLPFYFFAGLILLSTVSVVGFVGYWICLATKIVVGR